MPPKLQQVAPAVGLATSTGGARAHQVVIEAWERDPGKPRDKPKGHGRG